MGVFDGGVFDDGVFDCDDAPGSGGPGSYYWGPMFSDFVVGGHYWYPHFPEGSSAASLIPPVGPGSAATFALDLEAGATLTMTWDTDVFKAYDGSEQRRGKLDLPARQIAGQAFLRGVAGRSTRAILSRYMYIGSPFLLALPWEEMTILDDATTVVLPVGDTSLIDWSVNGQRAVVATDSDDNGPTLFQDVIVQTVSPSTITIDAAVPSLSVAGSRIMPTVAVILDPTQSFGRFTTPDGIERWAVSCQAILFGYEQDDAAARASLSASTAALHGATVSYASVGKDGNGFSLAFVADATSPSSHLETVDVRTYRFHFTPATTTVSDFIVATNGLFVLSGVYAPGDMLQLGDVISVTLMGGALRSWGAMGNGVELATFRDMPIWDRDLVVDEVAAESVISLSTIIDLGGKPISVGQANAADWGRQVMARGLIGEPWQWVKKFLYTVAGRLHAWWLPTWRADLDAVASSSAGVYTLKVSGPDFDSGDFFGWYPKLRDSLRIEIDDGSVVYAQIDSALDNHDGTITVVCREQVPPPGNASITFTTGEFGYRGYVLHRVTPTGSAGNTGSVELRADGTGGTVLGGGGVSVTADGFGNIVLHFNPGVSRVGDVLLTLLLAYPFMFNWTNDIAPSLLPLTSADATSALPFVDGADVGEVGAIIELPPGEIVLVSWLERCRFDTDQFTITFRGSVFEMPSTARVVQR